MIPRRRPVYPGFTHALGAPIVALGLLCANVCIAQDASAGGAGGHRAGAPNPFASSGLWDDGQAEVNAYDAAERRYGVLRPFTAYLIVVKEDFSRAQLVKADPGHDRADLVTVLKMNQVVNYQTGIYSYHQMASTFFERGSMDLLKFSLTSFEWCGNSYKEYERRGDKARLHVHTYWDGQAEATYDIPAEPDVVLYDQVPLWVRSLPQEPGASRSLRLVPGQIGSKGPKPEVRAATLRATGEQSLTTPAGKFQVLRWELKAGNGAPGNAGRAAGDASARPTAGDAPDVYFVAREFPHLLVGWDKPDGGSYRLKWTQRLPYWQLNAPGGERYLEGPRAGAPAGPAGAP